MDMSRRWDEDEEPVGGLRFLMIARVRSKLVCSGLARICFFSCVCVRVCVLWATKSQIPPCIRGLDVVGGRNWLNTHKHAPVSLHQLVPTEVSIHIASCDLFPCFLLSSFHSCHSVSFPPFSSACTKWVFDDRNAFSLSPSCFRYLLITIARSWQSS